MGLRRLVGFALVALSAGAADADTLGDLLRARGLTPPERARPHLGQTVPTPQVLDDERDLLIAHGGRDGEGARLHLLRFHRASRAWTTTALAWTAAPATRRALDVASCRSGLAVSRFPGGFLVRAHINPSAECTVVLGPDLALRAVLAGWPVGILSDGRLVYQRNQVHFASFHPVALALFDPRRPADVALYPRKPHPPMRAAHIERMRAMYTDTWCKVRNHPCDPEVFDERVDGEVATDARGDTIAFVLAWDTPTGGSEAERRPAGAGPAPDELTEVVYVYTGLRRPDTMRYREVGRRDFEARFGPGLPRRAIEPAVVRALFGPRPAP